MKTLRLIFALFCFGITAYAQVQEGGPLYVPSVGGPVLGTTTVTMTNAACNVLSPGSTCTLTAPGAAAARPWYLNQSLAGTCGGSSTITYPLGQHYIFSNSCGAAVTMGGATGATVSIPSGATNFEVNSPDGANYYIVGSGGSTGASVTFAATGGASAGSSFNGSSALTVDYHTVGAQGAGNYLTTDGSITGALVNPQVFQQGVWATLGGVSTANPLPATVGYNYSATPTYMDGNYWTGTASAQDAWSFGSVLGTGTNPTSTLTFTHVGSPGAANIAMPALSVAGSPVCTTATGCGSTMTYPGANTIGVANSGNTAWRTPLFSDITSLFDSGSCSGLLKSDGTCPLASTLNVNSALDVQCSLSDGCQNDNVWNSPWTATGPPQLAVGYPLGASDTTMTIVTLAGMPLAGHVVTTTQEEIGFTYVSSSGGNSTYTITRGHHGTPARAVSVAQGNMAGIISEVSACTTCGVYQQWGGNGSSIGVYNPGLTASFYAWSISINAGSPITNSGPGGVLGTAINHAATDFEPALGNPGTNGYVLSSTTGGTRSWIAPTSGALLATGATTGATSQAQAFTDGVTLSNLSSYSGNLASIGSGGALSNSGIAASNVLKADGTVTGATSQTQSFANGIRADGGVGVGQAPIANVGLAQFGAGDQTLISANTTTGGGSFQLIWGAAPRELDLVDGATGYTRWSFKVADLSFNSSGPTHAGADSTDYSTASSAQVAHCLADGTNCPTFSGAVYNPSGTLQTSSHTVIGTGNFDISDPTTITFSGSAVFTSSSTYVCTANVSSGTGGAPIVVTYTSGTTVKFTETGFSDTFAFSCTGN